MNMNESVGTSDMTDPKALAERLRRNWSNADILRAADMLDALTEQHEAFKQEVSDAVEEWGERWIGAGESHSYFMSLFSHFILPKPADPLVEALNDMKDGRAGSTTESYAACLHQALAARGLKIVEDRT